MISMAGVTQCHGQVTHRCVKSSTDNKSHSFSKNEKDGTECFHCHQLLHQGEKEIRCYDAALHKCNGVDTAHHGKVCSSRLPPMRSVHFGSQ